MSDDKKEEKKKEAAAPSTIRRKRKKGAAHAVKIPQGELLVYMSGHIRYPNWSVMTGVLFLTLKDECG